jgi:hypothetical protein
MRLKSVAILSASLLSLAAAPAANAATFFFNLSVNSNVTSGPLGNVRTFSATTGGTTINVQATAWRESSDVVRSAFLGAYGNGLGVTNHREGTGGNNTHTTDNSSGVDFILFQFDKPVEFLSGRFTTYELCDGCAQDSDATIDFGTVATPWTSPLSLDNTNISVVNGLLNGAGYAANGGSASNGVVRDLQPGNPGDKIGNLWMVAAAFTNPDTKKDAFKFDDLSVSYVDPLPEPGSWALMLAGFGMVGFSLRRRKALAAA